MTQPAPGTGHRPRQAVSTTDLPPGTGHRPRHITGATDVAPGIGRRTAAIVAVAAMLPYLTLKVLWLTGSSLGVSDPSLMNDRRWSG